MAYERARGLDGHAHRLAVDEPTYADAQQLAGFGQLAYNKPSVGLHLLRELVVVTWRRAGPGQSASFEPRPEEYLGEFRVRRVELTESTLTPEGAVYRTVRAFALS